MLIDNFHRIHNYLRISLTDQCNFRCTYCMPHENMQFMPKKNLMQRNEILELAKIFIDLGINKIRLTGGEPLLRKDFAGILEDLSGLGVELCMTTNGVLLDQYFKQLKTAGLKSINISLDSLNPESFKQITQRNQFHKVWTNIMLALEEGISVKINVVQKKGYIKNELLDFVQITKKLPLHVRFIEFMPFEKNQWKSEEVISANQMLEEVKSEFDIVKLKDFPHDTAKKYKVIGYEGTFAFITTMSEHFCNDCNRLRLTADGKIKNCLLGEEELNLLQTLRNGLDIIPLIQQSVQRKFAIMGGQFPKGFTDTNPNELKNRSMIAIGG
jgi:molybdenum cofactor biosynthesis protein A